MRVISDDERRARLGIRHALADPAPSVEDAVASVVCLHATEPANVHLAAFARSGASRDEVDRALYEDRTVVRQLAMRRTVFSSTDMNGHTPWKSAGRAIAPACAGGQRRMWGPRCSSVIPDGESRSGIACRIWRMNLDTVISAQARIHTH